MELRVIAGSLKRRALRIKGAAADFRPTLGRTREAVAESLKTRLHGAAVADLCAGSGIFGFEMISRGARIAHFVENNAVRVRAIAEHAKLFGIENQCRLFNVDIGRFVRQTSARYDIVYFDPPYDEHGLAELVPLVARLLAGDGVCLFEHASADEPLTPNLDGFSVRRRTYGRASIDYITRLPVGGIEQGPVK